MKKWHYSWVILAVTFLAIIVAGIIRSSAGVFIDPFEQDFGWSRPSISFAFAVSLFLYGFSGPFMAAFVEKYGLKRMMLGSMTLLAIALACTFVMQKEWQLVLIWGVMMGIGSGSTEFHVLRPIPGKSNPYWLYILTMFESFRVGARKVMTGTGGQLRVPIGYLNDYSISLPPIELQERFEEIVHQSDKSKFCSSNRNLSRCLVRYKTTNDSSL